MDDPLSTATSEDKPIKAAAPPTTETPPINTAAQRINWVKVGKVVSKYGHILLDALDAILRHTGLVNPAAVTAIIVLDGSELLTRKEYAEFKNLLSELESKDAQVEDVENGIPDGALLVDKNGNIEVSCLKWDLQSEDWRGFPWT